MGATSLIPMPARALVCRHIMAPWCCRRLQQTSAGSQRQSLSGATGGDGGGSDDDAFDDAADDACRPTLSPSMWSYPGNGGFRLRGRNYLHDRKKVRHNSHRHPTCFNVLPLAARLCCFSRRSLRRSLHDTCCEVHRAPRN